jgi:hypothetical protein
MNPHVPGGTGDDGVELDLGDVTPEVIARRASQSSPPSTSRRIWRRKIRFPQLAGLIILNLGHG